MQLSWLFIGIVVIKRHNNYVSHRFPCFTIYNKSASSCEHVYKLLLQKKHCYCTNLKQYEAYSNNGEAQGVN